MDSKRSPYHCIFDGEQLIFDFVGLLICPKCLHNFMLIKDQDGNSAIADITQRKDARTSPTDKSNLN